MSDYSKNIERYIGLLEECRTDIESRTKKIAEMIKIKNTDKSVSEVDEAFLQMNLFFMTEFQVVLGFLKINYQILKSLDDVVLKLPDKKEFDDLKTELESQKHKIVETLTPLAELVEKTKKMRGDNLGYIH